MPPGQSTGLGFSLWSTQGEDDDKGPCCNVQAGSDRDRQQRQEALPLGSLERRAFSGQGGTPAGRELCLRSFALVAGHSRASDDAQSAPLAERAMDIESLPHVQGPGAPAPPEASGREVKPLLRTGFFRSRTITQIQN